MGNWDPGTMLNVFHKTPCKYSTTANYISLFSRIMTPTAEYISLFSRIMTPTADEVPSVDGQV